MLIQFGALRYAYMRLGVGSGAALALLFGSLIGSYFNIPIAQLPQEKVVTGHEVDFFGMRYVVPVVVQWPGTLLAVNVGSAVIPSVMSAYLLLKHQLWAKGAVAVAIVAIACNWMAEPVPGMGIALPIFVPAAVTTITALILSREHAAQLAYIGGTLGTLIGADLLNLGNSYEVKGDQYVAIITDTRDDTPLGRPHIENGKRVTVPNTKIKWDRGNPTGHGIIFLGDGGEVYCYLPPGGG